MSNTRSLNCRSGVVNQSTETLSKWNDGASREKRAGFRPLPEPSLNAAAAGGQPQTDLASL